MEGEGMIVATLGHLDTNDLTGKRFRKAFDWIASQDLEALAPGRHDIDGDTVFANVFEFDTVPADQKHYEAHRRYYDIHFLISGEEKIGVAPVAELEPLQEFDDENDFCLYGESDHASWVVLHPGEFCVTPPEDAHKPGCATGEPAPLKKICLKVAVG